MNLDKATYGFYWQELGRSIIPDNKAFQLHLLANRLYLEKLIEDGLVVEKKENGFVSALCMMVEVDYEATLAVSKAPIINESFGGHSYSISATALDLQAQKDVTSTASKKLFWIKMFCHLLQGV